MRKHSPLQGKVVIVTRPRDRGEKLAAALRRRGLRAVFAPLIRTAPPRSWRSLDRALLQWAKHDAVIFASAAAVDAFFDRARRILGRRPAPPPISAAVGSATARTLALRGWRAAWVPEEHRAEGLAAGLRLARGSRVLLPRAERGREILPRLLRRQGARVTIAAAYRTMPDLAGRQALRRALSNGASAACFASGSAVESAAAALGPRRFRRAFSVCAAIAIGPVTAGTLRRCGVVPAATAARPDANSLAAAAARALAKRSRS